MPPPTPPPPIPPVPPPFSGWVFIGLIVVFGASCLMFYLHVRRWTHNRLWVALGDWATNNRFRLRRAQQAAVPPPLAERSRPPPQALIGLTGDRTTVLQMDTPAGVVHGGVGRPQRWNVLVREIDVEWPATALRPSAHERSLVDLFGLASFPALLSSERFTVHGAESSAARAVVSSMLMALLPQDLGLILHGRRLILDFSTRPFDGIELSRVVSLTDQLAAHLPPLGNRSILGKTTGCRFHTSPSSIFLEICDFYCHLPARARYSLWRPRGSSKKGRRRMALR
jgi:hypothetical protein